MKEESERQTLEPPGEEAKKQTDNAHRGEGKRWAGRMGCRN